MNALNVVYIFASEGILYHTFAWQYMGPVDVILKRRCPNELQLPHFLQRNILTKLRRAAGVEARFSVAAGL